MSHDYGKTERRADGDRHMGASIHHSFQCGSALLEARFALLSKAK